MVWKSQNKQAKTDALGLCACHRDLGSAESLRDCLSNKGGYHHLNTGQMDFYVAIWLLLAVVHHLAAASCMRFTLKWFRFAQT